MKKHIIILLLILPINAIAGSASNNKKITNLITPVSYFVNHIKQLKKIGENLDKYNTTSIVGMSGIGKTQIARIYAYENQNKYDLIWFIDCNLDINQEFLKLAKILNKERQAGIAEQADVAKNGVLDYIKDKKNSLLVLDNLKVSENSKVKDVVDLEHNGHIIFASQDKQALPYTIELANFNKDDCIKLAESILHEPSKTKTDFLSNNLKGYPILVVQTAQLLNQFKGLELETYKRKILESSDKIKLNISVAIDKLSPSAVGLLYQIALINNQSFSKDFLKYIASDKSNIEDDIYQISKFSLITNIEADAKNPVLEMHDIIMQTILEMMGRERVKSTLEKTVDNLITSTPDTISEFHVFRGGNTVSENFQVISEHAEKYKINLLKTMSIKSYLITIYNNYSNYFGAEKLVEWLNRAKKEKALKVSSMDNDQKARYADLLQGIARYYRNRYSDFDKSIQYSKEAEKVYENVVGYNELKADLFYQLALNDLKTGNTDSAKKYIPKLQNTPFNDNVQAMLFFIQGEYNKALTGIDNVIKKRLKKIKSDDLVLTSNYLLKNQILNFLEEYQKAYNQAIQLYNMHSNKQKDHIIFAKIYTQMAKSELGLKKLSEASEHIAKAMQIFLKDKELNAKKDDYSENLYLADCYVVQGDILFSQNKIEKAITSYRNAQKIYFYLYKNKRGNIEQVSYLYTQGAKASCKKQDAYHYKCFGKPQIAEFGIEHPDTISMLSYCKKYDMDLWADTN